MMRDRMAILKLAIKAKKLDKARRLNYYAIFRSIIYG